jgi:hypothetical protein
MMMGNEERFVQIALEAFNKVSLDAVDRNYFELHLRRLVMQGGSSLPLTKTTGFPGVTITSTGTANQHILHG